MCVQNGNHRSTIASIPKIINGDFKKVSYLHVTTVYKALTVKDTYSTSNLDNHPKHTKLNQGHAHLLSCTRIQFSPVSVARNSYMLSTSLLLCLLDMWAIDQTLGQHGGIVSIFLHVSVCQDNTNVPDNRGVLGQKPEKAGHLTRQNKWLNLRR